MVVVVVVVVAAVVVVVVAVVAVVAVFIHSDARAGRPALAGIGLMTKNNEQLPCVAAPWSSTTQER